MRLKWVIWSISFRFPISFRSAIPVFLGLSTPDDMDDMDLNDSVVRLSNNMIMTL